MIPLPLFLPLAAAKKILYMPDYKNNWWIVFTLLLLAVVFILNGGGNRKTASKISAADTSFLAHPNVRDPLLETPQIKQAGFSYKCNECHQNIEPPLAGRPLIAAHQHIKLEHGVNNECFNCHNPKNRETLLDINAKEIPFAQSELLCRKCHGPTYRDWAIGVHGRPSGYWDKSKGEEFKAICTACHDPHSPQFKPIKPSPGPSTVDHEQREEHKEDE